MNEDSLFGSADILYCPFNEYSWNNDKEAYSWLQSVLKEITE
jgi:hypothetical protein